MKNRHSKNTGSQTKTTRIEERKMNKGTTISKTFKLIRKSLKKGFKKMKKFVGLSTKPSKKEFKRSILANFVTATILNGTEVFFFSRDMMLDEIYQIVKRTEENLRDFMKTLNISYNYPRKYQLPYESNVTDEEEYKYGIEAKKYYEENKSKYNNIDEMVNDLDIPKMERRGGLKYREVFLETLRDSHSEEYKLRASERDKARERESAKRDDEIKSIELKLSSVDKDEEGSEDKIKALEKRLEHLKMIQEIEKGLSRDSSNRLTAIDKLILPKKEDEVKNKLAEEEIEKDLKEPGSTTKNQEKRDDITVMKDDINAMKGNIETINESLKKMSDFIDEQRRKEEERTKEETETKADNMTTLFNNLNEVSGKLITAVETLQKNVDPAAGNDNILPIFLSEEDKIFISTQIAEKLNEEETIEPVEQPAEGVTNEELGIEVRDSKRSLKGEIGDIKSKLDFLIKLIGKKAMTFEDIYQMLARRMARDHEMQTGRKIVY